MKRKTLIKHYKSILVDVINSIFKKNSYGRKNKFPIEFYLDYIFRILFFGEFWNTFYFKSSIVLHVIDHLKDWNYPKKILSLEST